ncbi:hypothetical protein FB451DRAFT_1178484 [Mycena latifolia]|nr:hypothetical protein FB451DRAFT_1178484 [Mycena latifolia]
MSDEREKDVGHSEECYIQVVTAGCAEADIFDGAGWAALNSVGSKAPREREWMCITVASSYSEDSSSSYLSSSHLALKVLLPSAGVPSWADLPTNQAPRRVLTILGSESHVTVRPVSLPCVAFNPHLVYVRCCIWPGPVALNRHDDGDICMTGSTVFSRVLCTAGYATQDKRFTLLLSLHATPQGSLSSFFIGNPLICKADGVQHLSPVAHGNIRQFGGKLEVELWGNPRELPKEVFPDVRQNGFGEHGQADSRRLAKTMTALETSKSELQRKKGCSGWWSGRSRALPSHQAAELWHTA